MNKPIEVLVTGDFYGGNRIEKLIMEDNYKQIFNDFLPHIQDVDIAITNLESPLIEKGTPLTKTGPAIKSKHETIKALKFAGFNLLTLANNHIMDYGTEGLSKTMDLCKKIGISTLGAGMNHYEASNTFYTEINGIKLAFINITENEWSTTANEKPGAHPLNPVANYYKIAEANTKADFVFVIVHGGHETYHLPSLRMKQTYRFFVDAGASAVLGHHTHCNSGYEMYKNSPIFYSLGNFIFDHQNITESSWNFGFAVKFKLITDNLSFEIIPYEQCKESVGVHLLKGKSEILFFEELKKLNTFISDDNSLNESFKRFVNQNLLKTYNGFLEPHSIKPLRILQRFGIFPSLLSKRKRKLYLNLIRCEAHRDVLLEILNNDSHT